LINLALALFIVQAKKKQSFLLKGAMLLWLRGFSFALVILWIGSFGWLFLEC